MITEESPLAFLCASPCGTGAVSLSQHPDWHAGLTLSTRVSREKLGDATPGRLMHPGTSEANKEILLVIDLEEPQYQVALPRKKKQNEHHHARSWMGWKTLHPKRLPGTSISMGDEVFQG